MPAKAEATVVAINDNGQIIGEVESDDDSGAFIWTLETLASD